MVAPPPGMLVMTMVLPVTCSKYLAIVRAVKASGGNRRMAADLVGIGEATLYRKLKEYGIS